VFPLHITNDWSNAGLTSDRAQQEPTRVETVFLLRQETGNSWKSWESAATVFFFPELKSILFPKLRLIRQNQTTELISKLIKGKVVPLRSIEAHLGDSRYSSYCFLTPALGRGEWSASRPGRALPPGERAPVPTV
jgi:hypothetical protein